METVEKMQREVAQWRDAGNVEQGSEEQETDGVTLATYNGESTAIKVESDVLPTKKSGGIHQFQKGNPGGPGRPKGAFGTEKYFRQLVAKYTTDEQFLAFWRSVCEGAAAGHNHKQKLFAAYTLGNPTAYIETGNGNVFVNILAQLDGRGE